MIFWLPQQIMRYIKLNWHHCWTICIKKDTNAAFTKLKSLKSKSHFWVKTIGAGNRPITQDRAASVKAIPPPTTIKTLRSFLGTTGYCRPWIEDYASIAQPLYDLLKGHGKDSDTVCMEELHLKAFNDLKRALCQAPALGIAQSDRPFVLYVHEHLGFMTACLMQDHGAAYAQFITIPVNLT